MKLLHFEIEGASLFKDKLLSLDLIATDRVAKQADLETYENVTRVGNGDSIYTLNIVGITGVNASGKTTALNLLRFTLAQLAGVYDMREFAVPQKRLGKLEDKIVLKTIFWHEGEYYLVESDLCRSPAEASLGYGDSGDSFTYRDETIWKLTAKRAKRPMLIDTEMFKENAVVILRRNGASSISDEARTFLNDRTSIATFVTKRIVSAIESPNRKLPAITMPTEVIQAFDGSIEKLAWNSESQVFHLKFKGEPERIVGMDAAVAMLSRGTVNGAELVDHAIDVLKEGGYLIVDEIEESLNRSLVGVVVDLFASPVTNPKGAQLVFSTHYPELLDLVSRKDSVYVFVRDENWLTSAVKYSDCVHRIENKKSAIINNNIISGSMPRYPNVQAMRDYVRKHVNE